MSKVMLPSGFFFPSSVVYLTKHEETVEINLGALRGRQAPAFSLSLDNPRPHVRTGFMLTERKNEEERTGANASYRHQKAFALLNCDVTF